MTDSNTIAPTTNGHTVQPQRIWLITGCSTGFGYRLARIALRRGDKVIATGRSQASLQKLVDESSQSADEKSRLRTLGFDLGDGLDVIRGKVEEAIGAWGRIDVLVNNAGWGNASITEELGSGEIQRSIDTNVMGTVNVTMSILPHMRARKSGTIVNIGSRSAWRAELPGIGSYAMVKAAVRAFTENLSAELAHLNIRVLLVEPGAFRTEGIYKHGYNKSNPIPDYDNLRTWSESIFASLPGNEPGDADKGMEAIVDVVRGEGVAHGRPWPKYLVLGGDAEKDIRAKCMTMLGVLEEWADVTRNVKFDGPNAVSL